MSGPNRALVAVSFITMLSLLGAVGPLAQTPPATEDTFSMALTGNTLMTRPLSPYKEPSFLKLMDLIRGADVAMTAFESGLNDYEAYAMPDVGTYMRADPAFAKDLAWAGFDLIGLATNHADNFGVEGERLTRKYIKEAGLVGAGTGESLTEAREAKFLETPKARVALISVSSSFASYSPAGKTRGDIPARPGLNPLRFTTTYVETPEKITQLRAILTEMRMAPGGGAAAQADRLNFLGSTFVSGAKADVLTEPDKRDMEEISAVVSNASRLADYTIVTIHAHQGDHGNEMPARFLVKFAHAVIDAGADVFSGHGATNVRGVEIYKGKPILYALGDFMWGVDTTLRQPVDSYDENNLGPNAGVADWNVAPGSRPQRNPENWEGVVAVPRWRGHQLLELSLHPISLGFAKKGIEYGRPMLADAAMSQKIANDVIQRSKPFGTQITMRDGVAYVDLTKH